jgi:hypothetical protein
VKQEVEFKKPVPDPELPAKLERVKKQAAARRAAREAAQEKAEFEKQEKIYKEAIEAAK